MSVRLITKSECDGCGAVHEVLGSQTIGWLPAGWTRIGSIDPGVGVGGFAILRDYCEGCAKKKRDTKEVLVGHVPVHGRGRLLTPAEYEEWWIKFTEGEKKVKPAFSSRATEPISAAGMVDLSKDWPEPEENA